MSGITVTIRNFASYRPRKEIKHPHWFKCSNRLLEDDDFEGFSFEEICVWIYILSLASQKDSQTISISFSAAERKCRLKAKSILSAVEKLLEKQMLVQSDHDVHTTSTQADHDLIPRRKEGIDRGSGAHGVGLNQLDQIQQNKEFERLSFAYTRTFANTTVGSKARERFFDQIKTREDLANLEQAMVNYLKRLEIDNKDREWRRAKTTFETFLGVKKAPFWRDHIVPPNIPQASGMGLVPD
jgi:hypothetical protein